MGGLFDWDRMTSIPYEDEVFGPVATVYLVVFLAGFLTAAVLYWRAPARFAGNLLVRRLSQRFASYFLWVCGVGLAFFIFRVMGLPALGIRLWLYIMVLALLAVIGYILFYSRTRYPAEREAYEAQQLKRRYQQASRRPVSPTGAPAPRSPRADKRRQRSNARQR